MFLLSAHCGLPLRSTETDTSLICMGKQHQRDYALKCGLFISAESEENATVLILIGKQTLKVLITFFFFKSLNKYAKSPSS